MIQNDYHSTQGSAGARHTGRMPSGKRSKDKLFVRQSELRSSKPSASGGEEEALPFDACFLSLAPFVHPVGTRLGTVYDLANIVPYVKKHHRDPVLGVPLTGRDLIRLHFHRNSEGRYHCPVSLEVFHRRSRIVAVATSGNVYSWEAVRPTAGEAAVSSADLLSGAPFDNRLASSGGDVIVIQDPSDAGAMRLRTHVALARTTDAEGDGPSGAPLAEGVASHLSVMARRTLAKAASLAVPEDPAKRTERERRERQAALDSMNGGLGFGSGVGPGGHRYATVSDGWAPPKLTERAARAIEAGRVVSALATMDKDMEAAECSAGSAIADVDDLYDRFDRMRVQRSTKRPREWVSSGAMAESLTSSAADVSTVERRAMPGRAELRERRWRRIASLKVPALATLTITIDNHPAGRMNVELWPWVAPRTVDNFLQLARRGYYDGVKFHRCIRNFMAQGGDPTGEGNGGQSCWGGIFKSEVDTSQARHNERGVLSMANSGPDRNGSQFFVLFKPAPHLDGDHSAFGKVVGGMEVIRSMEAVPVDDDDRPKRDVVVERVEVVADPFFDDAASLFRVQEPVEAAKPLDVVPEGGSVGRYLAKRVKRG
jgi:peptidyl-prolyl cis-trans isomerase-like 2